MRADIERAAQAVRVAAEFDWTWTVNDLQPFCDRVGWQLSGLDEQFPAATTNLEVNRPDASLFVADAPTPGLPRPINQIWFRVSDVVLDRTDLGPELDEVFDALVQRIFELLGQRPTGWWIEPTRGLRWDLPAVVVTAAISATSVYVDLASPAYRQWEDEIEQSGDDE
ncbi:DUF6301 family protein [Nocardia amikacinitolerans]|uniref:DUF6301 family protein n=1 Tax=Nocardia amikacinitolerans TaxID=756689 RepID=UPI0020A3CE77|nr:DUF6301 family protein [Nocardia amikacinitolerans]MCP2291730.1 hypothetical protein [Nocardia amikacinitolerans]